MSDCVLVRRTVRIGRTAILSSPILLTVTCARTFRQRFAVPGRHAGRVSWAMAFQPHQLTASLAVEYPVACGSGWERHGQGSFRSDRLCQLGDVTYKRMTEDPDPRHVGDNPHGPIIAERAGIVVPLMIPSAMQCRSSSSNSPKRSSHGRFTFHRTRSDF